MKKERPILLLILILFLCNGGTLDKKPAEEAPEHHFILKGSNQLQEIMAQGAIDDRFSFDPENNGAESGSEYRRGSSRPEFNGHLDLQFLSHATPNLLLIDRPPPGVSC